MGKGIYSGESSIGRCDYYSNPYDMRQHSHPGIASQRQANYLKSQDTLSNAHLRLEKEIFLKIKENGSNSSWDKFVVIAAVGKFVFLAVMLPPYMLCYGIPKWVVMEGFFKFYALISRMLRPLSNRFSLSLQKFIQTFKRLSAHITSPLLNFIQTRIEAIYKFYNQIKQTMGEIISYPFRLFEKKVQMPLQAVLSRIEEKLDFIKTTYQKFEAQIARLFQGSLKIFERIKGFKFPTNHRLRFKEPLRSFQNFITDSFKKGFQSVKNIFNNSFLFFQNILKRPVEALNNMKAILEKIQEKFTPETAIFRKIFEKIKGKMEAFFSKSIQLIENTAKPVLNLLTAAIQMIPLPGFSLFTPLISMISFSLNPKKRSNSFKSFLKHVQEIVDSALRQAASWSYKHRSNMVKIIEKVAKKIAMLLINIAIFLKKLIMFLIEAFKGLFLVFSLMVAWTRALARYGFFLLQKTSL